MKPWLNLISNNRIWVLSFGILQVRRWHPNGLGPSPHSKRHNWAKSSFKTPLILEITTFQELKIIYFHPTIHFVDVLFISFQFNISMINAFKTPGKLLVSITWNLNTISFLSYIIIWFFLYWCSSSYMKFLLEILNLKNSYSSSYLKQLKSQGR